MRHLNHCFALVLHCPWFRESVAHQLAGGNHEYFVGSISVYLLAMIYCMVSYILYGILHIVLMTADVPAGFLLLTGFCL